MKTGAASASPVECRILVVISRRVTHFSRLRDHVLEMERIGPIVHAHDTPAMLIHSLTDRHPIVFRSVYSSFEVNRYDRPKLFIGIWQGHNIEVAAATV
jgi:hypothetical protein